MAFFISCRHIVSYLGLTSPQSPNQVSETGSFFLKGIQLGDARRSEVETQKYTAQQEADQQENALELEHEKERAKTADQANVIAQQRLKESYSNARTTLKTAIGTLSAYADPSVYDPQAVGKIQDTIKGLVNQSSQLDQAEAQGKPAPNVDISNVALPTTFNRQHQQKLEAETTEAVNRSNLTGYQLREAIQKVGGNWNPKGGVVGTTTPKKLTDADKNINNLTQSLGNYYSLQGKIDDVGKQYESQYGAKYSLDNTPAKDLPAGAENTLKTQEEFRKAQVAEGQNLRGYYSQAVMDVINGEHTDDTADPRLIVSRLQASGIIDQGSVANLDKRPLLLTAAEGTINRYKGKQDLSDDEKYEYNSAIKLYNVLGGPVTGTQFQPAPIGGYGAWRNSTLGTSSQNAGSSQQ